MADTMEIYSDLVKERTSYSANPFTLTDIKVGDILMEEDGILTSAGTNIKDKFNYDIKTIQNPYHGNMEFSTQGVKSAITKIGGEGFQVNFTIDVEFTKDSQVFFHIEDAHVVEIADKIALGKEMLKWYKENNFESNWRVVTEVVYASMTAIAISQENNSSYKIGFNMLPVTAENPLPVNLPANFNFQADIGAANKNSLSYEMSQKYSSPLLHMAQVHRFLIFKPHIDMKLTKEEFSKVEKEELSEKLSGLQKQVLQLMSGEVIAKQQEVTPKNNGEEIEIFEVTEI